MVDNIELIGNLSFVRYVQMPGKGVENVRSLYIDQNKNFWLCKSQATIQEVLNEFVGSNLVNLYNSEGTYSPIIKTHSQCAGFLSEYIPNVEMFNWLEGPKPSWFKSDSILVDELGVGYVRGFNNKERQHLIACLVNDDYDRNPINYGSTEDKLWVFDHSGGRWNSEFDLEYGTESMKRSSLLEKDLIIENFKLGIETIKKAMNSGLYEKIIELSGTEDENKLKKLINNTNNIENILSELFNNFNRNN